MSRSARTALACLLSALLAGGLGYALRPAEACARARHVVACSDCQSVVGQLAGQVVKAAHAPAPGPAGPPAPEEAAK